MLCKLSWNELLAYGPIPAGEIEGLVLDRLRAFLASRSELAEAMAPLDLPADVLEAVLYRASQLADRWLIVPPAEVTELIRTIIEQVSIAPNHIDVSVAQSGLTKALGGGQATNDKNRTSTVLSIMASLRRAGKGKRLVIEGSGTREVDESLVELLRRAFAVRNALLSGTDDSLAAMTLRLGLGNGQLVALMRLSWLAPDIIRDCVEGRQPVGMTPTRLLKLGKDLPHDWSHRAPTSGLRIEGKPKLHFRRPKSGLQRHRAVFSGPGPRLGSLAGCDPTDVVINRGHCGTFLACRTGGKIYQFQRVSWLCWQSGAN